MEDCDERLYSKRKEGGRGLKSLKEVYDETKTRVACMLHVYSNKRMDNGSMEKQNPQGTDPGGALPLLRQRGCAPSLGVFFKEKFSHWV